MRRRLDDATKAKIRELYQQGIRPTDIATMLGVSLIQVYYWGDPEWRERHKKKAIKYAREWQKRNWRKLRLKTLVNHIKRGLREYATDEAWQAVKAALITYAKAAKDSELEEVVVEA